MKLKFRLTEFLDDIKTDIEFNHKDRSYLGKVSDDIAKDIYDLLDSFTDNELDEVFTSEKSLNSHFNHHCLSKYVRKSTRSNVLYDFKSVNEYRRYEKLVNSKCQHPDIVIGSLLDTELIIKAFRELFGGSTTIEFSTKCGFKNVNGPVIICLNAFSSAYTTNYLGGNSIDVCVLSPTYRTISLYSVDANRLETRFNNLISKYSDNKDVRLYFNH